MPSNSENEKQQGFSYIDVMIAIVIMTVGILAMTSAILSSLIRSTQTESRLKAKQIVTSTVESIFAARDIHSPNGIAGWSSVGNVGNNDVNGVKKGIFIKDWHPVREDAGVDGVYGTADDSCSGAGACAGTGGYSNTSPVLQNLERKIVITDIKDPQRPPEIWGYSRRQIDVIVEYNVSGFVGKEETTTFITNFEN